MRALVVKEQMGKSFTFFRTGEQGLCALTGIILAALVGQNQGSIGKLSYGSPAYLRWHHGRVNQDPPY